MNKMIIRWWRVINALLISLGLIGPWIRIYFDIQVVNQDIPAVAGGLILIAMWQSVVNSLITYGFELYMLPFWLMSLGGVLLILYFLFNLFSLIINRDKKSHKTVTIILIGVALVFLFPLTIHGDRLWGYWLINIGIWSSVVLEWQKQVDQRDYQIGSSET